MIELCDLTATALQQKLQRRECSAAEVAESCCDRIESLEPKVKSFVHYERSAVVEQARRLDSSGARGPLHGIPVAIKDTIDVAGLICSWGTAVHGKRIPTQDAAVVRRLREAGAVIVGTTVSTEYAIARSGPTRNPHDLARTPGGSSSGSGAAVAARMVPIALGTQTLGSIVRPATHCGIYGYKPTVGTISMDGVMPLLPMFDVIGPMARCLDDIALCNAVISPLSGSTQDRPKAGAPILQITGPYEERIEPETAVALHETSAILQAAGHPVVSHQLPDEFSSLTECFETLVFRAMAQEHGRDRDEHGEMMSGRFREIIDRGRAVTQIEYQAALAKRQIYCDYLDSLLDIDSIVLAPATDGVAPPYSERTGDQKVQSLWSVVGYPALAVPCSPIDGLPVGVQLVCKRAKDALVIAAGRILESGLAHVFAS